MITPECWCKLSAFPPSHKLHRTLRANSRTPPHPNFTPAAPTALLPSLRREPPWEPRRPAAPNGTLPDPLLCPDPGRAPKCTSAGYPASASGTFLQMSMCFWLVAVPRSNTHTHASRLLRLLFALFALFAPRTRQPNHIFQFRPSPSDCSGLAPTQTSTVANLLSCVPGKQFFSVKAFSTEGRSHSAACCYTSVKEKVVLCLMTSVRRRSDVVQASGTGDRSWFSFKDFLHTFTFTDAMLRGALSEDGSGSEGLKA